MTEWRFKPYAATGFHKHELDFVITPMTDGKLLLKGLDGDSYAELKAGIPYFKEAGIEHDVINDNALEFIFLETELK